MESLSHILCDPTTAKEKDTEVSFFERVPRIELGTKLWQSLELPLHHTRM